MNAKRLVTVSKFLSKHLRHAPEEIGLTLQPAGWVGVDELLAASARAGFSISRADLDEVVAENSKQRFAFDADGGRIRANQGHSVEIDLELEPATPATVLYHGTAGAETIQSILSTGLKKMSRHHVHLSADLDAAVKVGMRRGKPVVFVVDAAKMSAEGHLFYVSANGVWLTDHVPPACLRLLHEENK